MILDILVDLDKIETIIEPEWLEEAGPTERVIGVANRRLQALGTSIRQQEQIQISKLQALDFLVQLIKLAVKPSEQMLLDQNNMAKEIAVAEVQIQLLLKIAAFALAQEYPNLIGHACTIRKGWKIVSVGKIDEIFKDQPVNFQTPSDVSGKKPVPEFFVSRKKGFA